MKRKIGIRIGTLAAAWLITSASTCVSRADSSYLLVQGPFGPSSTEQTYKWQVNYPTGDLVTGQDLLDAVFGNNTQPTYIGTYTDGFGDAPYPEYEASNGSISVNYIYFANPGGYFPISFTLNGTTVLQDPTYDPSWNYYVAGGGGGEGSDFSGAPYSNDGSWTFSNDGIDARTISDGSYDGWVFGYTGFDDGEPAATIDNTSGVDAPTAGTFSNTTPTDFFSVVNVIPEPGAQALLLIAVPGVVALAFRKKKARA